MKHFDRAAALGSACEGVHARALAALALVAEQQTERSLERLGKVTSEAPACGLDRRVEEISEQPPGDATARAYALLKQDLERRIGSPLPDS